MFDDPTINNMQTAPAKAEEDVDFESAEEQGNVEDGEEIDAKKEIREIENASSEQALDTGNYDILQENYPDEAMEIQITGGNFAKAAEFIEKCVQASNTNDMGFLGLGSKYDNQTLERVAMEGARIDKEFKEEYNKLDGNPEKVKKLAVYFAEMTEKGEVGGYFEKMG